VSTEALVRFGQLAWLLRAEDGLRWCGEETPFEAWTGPGVRRRNMMCQNGNGRERLSRTAVGRLKHSSECVALDRSTLETTEDGEEGRRSREIRTSPMSSPIADSLEYRSL
jgi:hypothetical protein